MYCRTSTGGDDPGPSLAGIRPSPQGSPTMECPRARLVAVPLLLALLASSLKAGGPSTTPWIGPGGTLQVDHHLLVKVAHGIELIEGDEADGWTSSGVPEIDQLDRIYDAIGIHRLFRDPPAGHRDPALFKQLGLDRFYFIAFRYGLGDPLAVAELYDDQITVEKCWPDGIVFHCNTPDDPLWSSQWNLTPEDVNCEPAWDDQTDSDVLVAIVDSGADFGHPDLDANVWVNPGEIPGNGKDDEGNGYVDDIHGWDFMNADEDPTDDCGHGTHVSGIVGAEGDNGIDVAGICWSATL